MGWSRHRSVSTWKEFLSRHREVIAAADFFTIEAWTRKGLTRFVVFFLMDLSSRRVEIAGVAREANGPWMSQVARNLSDAAEGFLVGKRYLIHDRDLLYTAEFLNIIQTTGIQPVKLPPRSPNLNGYAERFVRTIKESCLERMILFGEGSVRKAIHEFVLHYSSRAQPPRSGQSANHPGTACRSQRCSRPVPLSLGWNAELLSSSGGLNEQVFEAINKTTGG